MKLFFQKKPVLWAAAAALVFLIAAAAAFLFLTQQADAKPENPIDGVNVERSQELVMGEGYVMNDKQKQAHKQEEKQKEKRNKEKQAEPEKESQTTGNGEGKLPVPSNDGKNGGDGGEEEDDPTEEPPGIEPEDPMLPVITTNLKQKEMVGGGYKGFWVKAHDYKNRYIDSGNLLVLVNGMKLYSSGDNGTKVSYGTELQEGENIIEITATDSYGKSKTVVYTIIGDSNKEAEIEGTITLTVEAGVIGLPILLGPVESEVVAGKPFPYTLKKALEDNGFQCGHTGSLNSGFYLARLYKAGITAGYQIPEELYTKLSDDIGTTISEADADSLGEKDITKLSGWTVQVNGEGLTYGMSGYIPRDGDDVRVRFTLWNSEDLGGSLGSW